MRRGVAAGAQVLPTGKNIHALDPQSIPTTAAVASASVVVERLLKRQKQDNGGKWPETIAVVLWGTDNIKTYGESLAQVRPSRSPCHATGMRMSPSSGAAAAEITTFDLIYSLACRAAARSDSRAGRGEVSARCIVLSQLSCGRYGPPCGLRGARGGR